MAVLVPLLLSSAAWAQGSSKPQAGEPPKAGEPYALITGTVFRDPGFAHGGAEVKLAASNEPERVLQTQKSSPRGEFAFRVAPGSGKYRIFTSFKGFQPVFKEVEIFGQEQIHATLMLVPESK